LLDISHLRVHEASFNIHMMGVIKQVLRLKPLLHWKKWWNYIF